MTPRDAPAYGRSDLKALGLLPNRDSSLAARCVSLYQIDKIRYHFMLFLPNCLSVCLIGRQIGRRVIGRRGRESDGWSRKAVEAAYLSEELEPRQGASAQGGAGLRPRPSATISYYLCNLLAPKITPYHHPTVYLCRRSTSRKHQRTSEEDARPSARHVRHCYRPQQSAALLRDATATGLSRLAEQRERPNSGRLPQYSRRCIVANNGHPTT